MPRARPAISGNFQLDASSLAGDQAMAKNTPNSQKVSARWSGKAGRSGRW